MLNGELGGLFKSSRNCVSEGPRLCWLACVGVAASSPSVEALVLLFSGARLGVARVLKASRLSEDEIVRSVEESRSRCWERCALSFGDSETTKTTPGDAVRPFLSVDISRLEGLVLSTDALRDEPAFLVRPVWGDACACFALRFASTPFCECPFGAAVGCWRCFSRDCK